PPTNDVRAFRRPNVLTFYLLSALSPPLFPGRIREVGNCCSVEALMMDRRGFLSSFAGLAGAAGTASALGLPAAAGATNAFGLRSVLPPKWLATLEDAGLKPGATQEPPKLPERALYDSNEEAYWTEMRKQFVIPADEVYLNNGTVGSCPLPVLRAVFDGYYDTEKMAQADPEDYPIWGYGPFNEFRDPLAEFVGCTRDELALVRNATEANSYIANGLDLKAGDEVLMTDQEHPGGEQPWNLRAKRYGIVVKKITLPRPVPNAAAALNLFNDAVTPRT